MRYTTLLMDADETIFDFGKCEYFALKGTVEAFGLRFDENVHNTFSAINKRLWKEFEKNRITNSELRVQRFRELIAECFDGFDEARVLADEYISQLSRQAVLISGAYEIVEELAEHHSLYVITNGISEVQRGRFARTDITRFFQNIFISDEMNVQKPKKEFFDMVLSEIPEKDKSRILVVGDSLTSDMQGGRNSGLDTCIYDPYDRISMPDPLCDYKVRTLREISRITMGGSV